jgi:hypothetical protein
MKELSQKDGESCFRFNFRKVIGSRVAPSCTPYVMLMVTEWQSPSAE